MGLKYVITLVLGFSITSLVVYSTYASGISSYRMIRSWLAGEETTLVDGFSLIPMVLGCVFCCTVSAYLVPLFAYHFVYSEQNLKRKYNASWALVTGGSSGVGAAITEKLAQQDINIVIAALEDRLLDEHTRYLRDKYPYIEVRAVGVNLGGKDYLDTISKATEDIDVNIVFNNAGYLKLGAYGKSPLEVQMTNFECNVISATKITHLFLHRMIEKGLRGAICFTSSSASLFPAPSQAMYASGKAFLSTFASCLAIEAAPYGIDVLSIQPGPMLTNFYSQNLGGKVPQLDAFKFFLAIANTSDEVADTLFRSIGRTTWLDTGAFSFLMRIVMRLVDMNLFVSLLKSSIHCSSDFQKHKELI